MSANPNVDYQIEQITVRLRLTEQGDGLFWGEGEGYRESPGRFLKHRLFAWHEPSFYGTELEVRTVGDEEIVILPAEQVVGFLADRTRLSHIGWVWEGEAARLLELAPALMKCLEERRYMPDFQAYQEGAGLQWTWDEEALEEPARDALAGGGLEADEAGQAVKTVRLETDTLRGLRAAFSAAVFARCYGTEAAAADLRREFPLLFAEGGAAAAAGLDARSWLVRIGWTADLAPFRPVLQLLEPKASKGSSGGREPRGGDGASGGLSDGGAATELPAEWKLRLVLQDKQDEARLVPVRLAGTGEAFGTWPSGWTAHVRERAGGWLEQLRASLPAGLVADGDDALRRPLDDGAAWRFLTADGPRLIQAGWQVLLPAWWEAARRKKPRLRAKIAQQQEQPQGGGRSLFGLDAILSFDWRIAIGDAELSEAEFKRLVARGERLVRFHDRWIALDPELLEQIQRAMDGMDKSQGLSFQDVLQLHLLGLAEADAGTDAIANVEEDGGELSPEEAERLAEEAAARLQIEVELNEHLAHLVSQLHQRDNLPKPETPAGLRAVLRSYQRDGFGWLAFLRRFGLGAVLADDMGLGKTVQLISYLLDMKENAPDGKPQPALIICPTSVLGNWQKELQRFAPSLGVMLHYGSGRVSDAEAFAEAAREADVVLTSYATASLDQETLQSFEWASICLDEAQNIKNAQTKQSAAVRSFKARHRVALTGTPVENRLAELWSIFDFIAPGYLGSQRAFQQRFATAIEQEGDKKKTAELRRLINPFMLRRKKKDPAIQLDLPDKNEMKTYIHLSAEQAAAYDRVVRELMEKLKKLEGIERKGAVLGALTRLKQVCDHPALMEGEDPLAAASGSSNSATETASRSPARKLAEAEIAAAVGRSSKLERLLDMVKELRDEDDKCLIFTQFVGMGQMIQAVLSKELGEPVLYLNGSTPKTQRDRMIERFQSRDLPPDEQPNVFVLSLKAGGVGLNLTAANHVFHFDRWWNPAVENQATDRAYRIGQTKDVQVHKFISLGTLEERIDEMLENKQALSDNVVSSSEGWITELSNDELRDLFTLRRDWA